jgi:hypothetical protein
MEESSVPRCHRTSSLRWPAAAAILVGTLIVMGNVDASARRAIRGTVRDEAGHPVANVEVRAVEPMKCATFGPVRTDQTETRTSADGRYELQAEPYWGLYFRLADHEPQHVTVPEVSCSGAGPLDVRMKLKAHLRAWRQIADQSPSPATDEILSTWLESLRVEADGAIDIEAIGEFYHELARFRPYLLHYISEASPGDNQETPAKDVLRAMQLIAYWADPDDATIARRWWSALGGDLDGLVDEQGEPVDVRTVGADQQRARFRKAVFEPDIPTMPTPPEAWSAWLNVVNRRMGPYCYSEQGASTDRYLLQTHQRPARKNPLQGHTPKRYWHVILRHTADGWDIPLYIERSPDPSRSSIYFYR